MLKNAVVAEFAIFAVFHVILLYSLFTDFFIVCHCST